MTFSCSIELTFSLFHLVYLATMITDPQHLVNSVYYHMREQEARQKYNMESRKGQICLDKCLVDPENYVLLPDIVAEEIANPTLGETEQ